MYVRVKHLINILFTCKVHDLFTYIGEKNGAFGILSIPRPVADNLNAVYNGSDR